MSLEETIKTETEAIKELVSPRFIKSCKDCGYCIERDNLLYCVQTTPPTYILSEYYAQNCNYYTVKRLVNFEVDPAYMTKTREQVWEDKEGSGGDVVKLFTVPDGKILYVDMAQLSATNDHATEVRYASLYAQDEKDALFRRLLILRLKPDGWDSVAVSIPTTLKIPEKYDVVIYAMAEVTPHGIFHGWLEE